MDVGTENQIVLTQSIIFFWQTVPMSNLAHNENSDLLKYSDSRKYRVLSIYMPLKKCVVYFVPTILLLTKRLGSKLNSRPLMKR